MTIKEISSHFKTELTGKYPESEIESFTFIVLHALMSYKPYEVYLHVNEEITPDVQGQIYLIIEQLKQNRPIQYIIGETEFYGLRFYTDESVLIPRQETEELVKWILDDNKNFSGKIIDIGTGSGCIAVSLAKHLSDSMVYGIDISLDALKVARNNALLNNVIAEFMQYDIIEKPLGDIGKFDIIVSNPPYVTLNQKSAMEANVLLYEPHLALFVPDDDPLIFYKSIAIFTKKFLSDNGSLYLEVNEVYGPECEELYSKEGYKTQLRKDLNGKYRMIKAMLK